MATEVASHSFVGWRAMEDPAGKALYIAMMEDIMDNANELLDKYRLFAEYDGASAVSEVFVEHLERVTGRSIRAIEHEFEDEVFATLVTLELYNRFLIIEEITK